MQLTFLGGAGCVTGSRHLAESGRTRLLIDCGLYQGYKHLRLRNWQPFPVKPSSLSAVALTHAHIDHSGYLPALVRDGYKGAIHCTPETADLCEILLIDAARLQEEDAKVANRLGYSRHHPALPMFTTKDAERALRQFRTHEPGIGFKVGGFKLDFLRNGHILGSSSLIVDDGKERVIFSGDVGRSDDPLMPPPELLPPCDRLVLESTYGARRHPRGAPTRDLERVILKTVERKGVLLIPAFAVGRAQEVAWLADQLMEAGKVPPIPVYMDSPMSQAACRVLYDHPGLTRLSGAEAKALQRRIRHVVTYRDSLALSKRKGPFILISSSGMLTGGRVLNHLAARATDKRNTLLFVGYQAGGTRGARIQAGERDIKVRGRKLHIDCGVESIGTLSAHADGPGIIDWLSRSGIKPRMTYLVHGEPPESDALRILLHERLGLVAHVPILGETAGEPA